MDSKTGKLRSRSPSRAWHLGRESYLFYVVIGEKGIFVSFLPKKEGVSRDGERRKFNRNQNVKLIQICRSNLAKH